MRHIFDPKNGRLPNRTSKIVVGGTEAQNPDKALENLHGIDIDIVGQPDGILGLNDAGRLYLENANLNTLFPVPRSRGPSSVYVNHTAYYLITNYDLNKEYVVSPIGGGETSIINNTVKYTAPNEPTVDGDGFTVNGVDFPITVLTIEVLNTVLEPSITIPNTSTIEYSETLYRFESTEFRYTGTLQHHSTSSWEIASDVNFSNIVTSVTESSNYKTAWELVDIETTDLLIDAVYYIRVKHAGDVTGDSPWSSGVKFQIKQDVAVELPWVKTPSIINYSFNSTAMVHPPFILHGGDSMDPSSMDTYRSLQINTDGFASACSLTHSAIQNGAQHIKNPPINYPSVGRYYGVGITVNAIERMGNELWLLGEGVAKYNPTTGNFVELTLNDITIPAIYGLKNICEHGGNIYATGASMDYIYKYDDSGAMPEFKPINETRAWWTDICSSNGYLYVSEASAGVHIVNTIDGTLTNIHDSSPVAGSYSSLESLNNKLYFTAGYIYKESITANIFDIADDTQDSFLELAASDDHMFVRTSDSFIYKQANGTGTFNLVVSDLSEITSMAVCGNILYTHVNWVTNYIPVQNGLGRYGMDGLPIYDNKTMIDNVYYGHTLLSSAFESIGGVQDHVSSTWQIALDNQFNNIVYEANKDTIYKTTLELAGLTPNINYYARLKHTGSTWGDSQWSSPYSFTFTDFNIPNDDFYDQILDNRSMELLGEIRHSVAVNGDGTVVAIGITEVQYEGLVDTDALIAIYKKTNGTWVRDGEFSIFGITQYGISMAINHTGNKLFVGAPFASSYGRVYFYERDEAEWFESNVFEDPIGGSDEGGGSECFGVAVTCNAMGNRIAVGRSAIDGVHYPGLTTNGSVHTYDLGLSGFWSDPTNIVATDLQLDSGFGAALSMSDDGYTLVIGAPNHNFNIGKVYIALYEDTTWSIAQSITPHDTDLDIQFGHSVSLSGDGKVIYIGAPYYDNGNDPNNILTDVGCVYIYVKATNTIDYYLNDQWVHYVSDEKFGKSISTNIDGSIVSISTEYKTIIYQKTHDDYIINTVEPINDIDPMTFGRIYTKANAISSSGTCVAQSLKYSDLDYNNYIHIKTLSRFNPQNHIGTDWQIATDREFTDIAVNVVNDSHSKETFVSPAIFPMRSIYYVRVRYNCENIGYTGWSLPMAIATAGGE